MNKNFVFSIMDYLRENMVDILLVVSFLIVILIFIVTKNVQIKDVEGMTVQDAEKQVNNENLNQNDEVNNDNTENDENEDDGVDDDSTQFCKVNEGQSHVLEEKCNSLQKDSCKAASCCVLANYSGGKSKCVAGSKLGPTYLSDDKLNLHEIDNYYYQNKCYGKNC